MDDIGPTSLGPVASLVITCLVFAVAWLLLEVRSIRRQLDALLQRAQHEVDGSGAPSGTTLDAPLPGHAHAAVVPAAAAAASTATGWREPPRGTPWVPAHAPSGLQRRGFRPTGGQLFAIAGGAFVLIGAALFVTMAISNGWIGPGGQVLLGFAFGAALFGAGAVFGRRRGHDTATLVAAGAGAGIVQLVNIAGATTLDVLADEAAIAVALLAGGAALWWAVRTSSQWLAAFGIATALAAPVLFGASASGSTLVLLSVALLASTAIVVVRGWTWLAVLGLCVTWPQLFAWADGADPGEVVVVGLAWWTVMLAAAIGFDELHEAERIRTASASLVFLAAGATAVLLFAALEGEDRELVGLAMLAGLHGIAAAALALRARSTGRPGTLAMLVLVAGSGVLALVIGEAASGSARVPFWTVEALALFGLRCAWRDVRAGVAAAVAAGLAVLAALYEAPPWNAYVGDPDLAQVILSVVPLVVGSAAALAELRGFERDALDARAHGVEPGREPAPRDGWIAQLLVVLLASSLAWLVATVGFDVGGGQARVVGLALVAAAAIFATSRRPLDAVVGAAWALSVLTVVDAIATLAPPTLLWEGAGDLAAALLGTTVVAALGSCAWGVLGGGRSARSVEVVNLATVGAIAIAAACLHAASICVVTALTPDPPAVETSQAAQLALSTLWGVVALGGIVAGLSRGLTRVHQTAAVLLAVSAAKVLLIDTSQLDAAYRVGVFVGVGLLMLVGGFAYLRMAGSSEPRT